MQEPTDWLKNISSEKVLSDAQAVMKSAFDVLEQEVAAGILSAKKLEKKILEKDIDQEQDPQSLLTRVRVDLHEAVDLVMDAVIALSSHVGKLATQMTGAKTAPAAVADPIPIVRSESSSKPGDVLLIPWTLVQAGEQPGELPQWAFSDLMGPPGKKILARHIAIVANSSATSPAHPFSIRVAIPKSCARGVYSGLVQNAVIGDPGAVLMVEVN